jgi:hypothetical protein
MDIKGGLFSFQARPVRTDKFNFTVVVVFWVYSVIFVIYKNFIVFCSA